MTNWVESERSALIQRRISLNSVMELFVCPEQSLKIICRPCDDVSALDFFKTADGLLAATLRRLLSSRAFQQEPDFQDFS